MTEDFANTPLLQRSVLFFLWSKVVLAKYIAAWLFAEGSCIVSGLGYNGKDEAGNVKWDGTANVKLRRLRIETFCDCTVCSIIPLRFETSYKFQHYIDSFNINTNAWVMSYVYKRLRFLNNKSLSQLGALGFLAVWHGYHSGYYVTFFTEFIVMMIEREVSVFLCTQFTLTVYV